ncbi:topoisomerase DNA-binding C4 zinc finger domain-containing protein [Alicyclobacillus sp. ALC3]|nr:topoisomerase DNA-binding C4 zinc finger domain-containing protein [Alicyclobacillus sp. ALC3]
MNGGRQCPKCSKQMVLRHGKYGSFFRCSGFPDCRQTQSIPPSISKEDDFKLALLTAEILKVKHDEEWRTRAFRESIAKREVHVTNVSGRRVLLKIQLLIGTELGDRIGDEYVFSALRARKNYYTSPSWIIDGQEFIDIEFVKVTTHSEQKTKRRLMSEMNYWANVGIYQEDCGCKFGFTYCLTSRENELGGSSSLLTEAPFPIAVDVLGYYSTHGLWKGDGLL